jgi:hypothetical protein
MTPDQLTPQELQVAHLASEGLTNRQIGQQLYLSHRTVIAMLASEESRPSTTSNRPCPLGLVAEDLGSQFILGWAGIVSPV